MNNNNIDEVTSLNRLCKNHTWSLFIDWCILVKMVAYNSKLYIYALTYIPMYTHKHIHTTAWTHTKKNICSYVYTYTSMTKALTQSYIKFIIKAKYLILKWPMLTLKLKKNQICKYFMTKKIYVF